MNTTININIDVLAKITRVAETQGISRSRLIVMLLHTVMDDANDECVMWRLVKYQPRARHDTWRIFHVSFRENEYEYFLDIRKILKMSLSHILAYAVSRYCGSGLNGIATDNYRFRNYVCIRETIDYCISWRFIWGYPLSMPCLLESGYR